MAADRGGATGTCATNQKWPLGGLSNLFIFISDESEQFHISVLVQHVSLHVCKSCNEPEILERAVHYN